MLSPSNMNVLKNPIIYTVFLEHSGGQRGGRDGQPFSSCSKNLFWIYIYIEIRDQSKCKHSLLLPCLLQSKPNQIQSTPLQETGPFPTLTFSFFSISKVTDFCWIKFSSIWQLLVEHCVSGRIPSTPHTLPHLTSWQSHEVGIIIITPQPTDKETKAQNS